MKIIDRRQFISSRRGFGNVPEGRVLETDDGYATMLIKAGLAEEYSAAHAPKAQAKPSFFHPVGVNTESGQSSLAAQASQSKTVKSLRNGDRKAKTARSS